MELFTVNRYTEESKGGVETANEDEILQKLLQKAEKRKRKHEAKKAQNIEESAAKNGDTKINETETTAKQAGTTIEATEQTVTADESTAAASSDFQVLGEDASAAKRQKVAMVLPAWLAHPTIIAGGSLKRDENTAVDADDAAIRNQTFLQKHIRQALKQMKIKRLFPVQRAVIPWVLEAHAKPAPFRPRDICVSAPTGSGKTLAFAIPIVQLLANRTQCKVRALVVLPVAELALQVYKVFSELCAKTELEVCLLSKQHRLEDEQEKLIEEYNGAFYSKVDIVVSTPGRLVDHLHATTGFCLKALQFLVIDEADRIMDAVFQNWIYHLDSHVRDTTDNLLAGRTAPLCMAELLASHSKQPQKLLFSATLTQDPEKLQNLRLFQPKLFTTVLTAVPALSENPAMTGKELTQREELGQFIGKFTTPAELKEQYCLTELRLKPLTLFALIQQYQWKRFLCFTNSADTSNRLAFVLRQLLTGQKVVIEELTANLSALQRNKTLSNFARGTVQGLICSDALARGIDVADVDIVVSYEVPRHIKTYIHRVGRTARAGKTGTAITMLTEKDQSQFEKLLAPVGKSVTEELHVSSDLEVEHAVIYKKALDGLRMHLESRKSQKVVQKRRTARLAAMHKDPSQMTLMEKLQMKVGVQETTKAPKKVPKKKIVPPGPQLMPLNANRKLNPNASKHKGIEN